MPCHLERRPKELATKGKSKDPDKVSIAMQRQGILSKETNTEREDVPLRYCIWKVSPSFACKATRVATYSWPRKSLHALGKCQGTTLASCPSRAPPGSARARAAQSCRKNSQKDFFLAPQARAQRSGVRRAIAAAQLRWQSGNAKMILMVLGEPKKAVQK
jgi:hypothetical protein